MDKLLNVKEAAAFLNVSEMTIRRWTNAGLLSCFRIGKKRERRFDPRQLQAFIAPETVPPKKVATVTRPLGLGNINVPDGSHLTHLHDNQEEALHLQVSFIRQGLENGETVLLIAPAASRQRCLQSLSQGGWKIATLLQQNRLHCDEGRESLAELLAYLARITATIPGRFRLLGDMAWAGEKQWPLARLKQLEESTNTQLSRPGALFLCQYDLATCSGREAMMACETHHYAVYQGRLTQPLQPPAATAAS
ncbi:MAG: MEDS domain-containing protein [Desulfurivibrio sp.]|nr:MEDS domain-containing protein [Desulfurivibrio sp.]